MNLPCYLITENDGIPIPDSIYRLDIPLHNISEFRVNLEHNENQVILGISNDEDTDSLRQDLKALMIYTRRIGLLCTVLDLVETDDFVLAEMKVEHRVYIEGFEGTKNIDGYYENIRVSIEEISEDFELGEESVISNIEKLVNLITTNPDLFSKKLVEEINSQEHLITKMNIIAEYILVDPVKRIKYIQYDNNNDRFSIIIEEAQNFIENNDSKESSPDTIVRKRKKNIRIRNADSIKARFKELHLDEEVKEHIEREVSKLDSLQKSSTEHSMVLDYMSWILDIPWNKYSQKESDLKNLVKILDKTHYGLKEVKQHVLEHMTIEKIKGGSTGTVLCFIGPPGTGKTSIAKQIAQATNRKLSRVALGGLSDEAEIRGHRRTYIGSRPGRLIVGLKKAGTMDPLFLLDEIDKLGNGRSDPAAALLEVLDGEQNDHFIDRYLEVPVDLSRAMFICTANYEHRIPEALKDRMEFIYFDKYTKAEREIITKQYLIPKAFQRLSLTEYPIKFHEEVIQQLIKTEQVRQIEKKIFKLLRMAAVDIIVHEISNVSIDKEYIKNLPKINTTNRIGFG